MLLKILRSTMHLFIFFSRNILRHCQKLHYINLSSCRALPRGMKREYKNKEIAKLKSFCGIKWNFSSIKFGTLIKNCSSFLFPFNKKPILSGIKRQTKWSVRCCGECAYIVHITISVNVLFHRDTISGIQTQVFFSEFHFFIATEYLVSPLMNSCLHIFNYTCIIDIILHKASVY